MSVEETNSIKDLLQNSIKTATINNEKDISKNNTESFPFLKGKLFKQIHCNTFLKFTQIGVTFLQIYLKTF